MASCVCSGNGSGGCRQLADIPSPGVGIEWKSGVLDIVLLFDLQIILILIQIHQNEKNIVPNTVSNTVSNTFNKNNGGSTTQQENSLINRLFMKLFLCIS
jgi:hypothetical protein